MYSEQISAHLKMSEKKLIKNLKNIQCKKCNLIYKKSWFKPNTLSKIFNTIVPTHPKGWDAGSKKFSKKYFKKNLQKLSYLMAQNNKALEINKNLRELISIADSLNVKKKKDISNKLNLIKYIKKKKISRIKFYYKKLTLKFKNAEEFKRFKGFYSESLIDHIKSIIGNINSYSEIGCPLWGNLNRLNPSIKCGFIKGKAHQFWGLKCSKANSLCYQKLKKRVKIYDKIPALQKKTDYLGAYLYLDHVLKPVSFIKTLFSYTNSIGLILENSDDGVPVQHFTGWNQTSIKYLANKLKKRIDFSFKNIKQTKKSFYIIY
jgi:hypothetical protein